MRGATPQENGWFLVQRRRPNQQSQRRQEGNSGTIYNRNNYRYQRRQGRNRPAFNTLLQRHQQHGARGYQTYLQWRHQPISLSYKHERKHNSPGNDTFSHLCPYPPNANLSNQLNEAHELINGTPAGWSSTTTKNNGTQPILSAINSYQPSAINSYQPPAFNTSQPPYLNIKMPRKKGASTSSFHHTKSTPNSKLITPQLQRNHQTTNYQASPSYKKITTTPLTGNSQQAAPPPQLTNQTRYHNPP